MTLRETRKPRKKKISFEPERVFALPDRSDDLKLDLDMSSYRARKGEGGDRHG